MITFNKEYVNEWYQRNDKPFFSVHPLIELNVYMRYIEQENKPFYDTIQIEIRSETSDELVLLHLVAMHQLEHYGYKYQEIYDPEDWSNLFWKYVFQMTYDNPKLNQAFAQALGIDESGQQVITPTTGDDSSLQPTTSSTPSIALTSLLDVKMFTFTDNFNFSPTTSLKKGDLLLALNDKVYVKNRDEDANGKFDLSDISIFVVTNNPDKFLALGL